jgi:ribosomal protein S18 acetylase RimI-like enzyme
MVAMAILREEWDRRRDCPTDGLCAIRPEHMEEVLALWSETGFWPHAGEDVEFIARALERNSDFAVGFRDSGELVGTAIGAFDGFRGWIYRVAVHPDHRRRGIASTMVGEVERRLAAAGARQINVMVYKPNAEAHTLYAKLGYKPSEVNVLRKRFTSWEEAGDGH